MGISRSMHKQYRQWRYEMTPYAYIIPNKSNMRITLNIQNTS